MPVIGDWARGIGRSFGDLSATKSALKWAAGLSVYAIVVRLGRGSAALGNQGLTLSGVLVTYWLGAIVTGLSLDSFLRKLRTSLCGYVVGGFLVMALVAFIANSTLLPKSFSGGDLIAFVLLVALILGCPCGAIA